MTISALVFVLICYTLAVINYIVGLAEKANHTHATVPPTNETIRSVGDVGVSETMYQNGVKHGMDRLFSWKGVIIAERVYDNGKLIACVDTRDVSK